MSKRRKPVVSKSPASNIPTTTPTKFAGVDEVEPVRPKLPPKARQIRNVPGVVTVTNERALGHD